MKVRTVLLTLAFILMFCAHQDDADFPGTIQELEKRLKAEIQAFEAEVGLAFKDLQTLETLFINGKEMMHAASLIKVPIMIEVFRQAEQGKFDLQSTLIVKNEFSSIVDGSPFSLDGEDDSDKETYELIGQPLSIRELVHRMISVSSNLTTNILIELVGANNVMKTLCDLGVCRMQVLRGVEDIKAYRQGLNNTTDACDMMLVMEAIATSQAGTKKACQQMMEILSQQEFRNKIPAGLPQGVKVANKTGSITHIDHDAALVFPSGRKPYVLVVLTRGIEDRQQAEHRIARLSRLVYKYIARKKQEES